MAELNYLDSIAAATVKLACEDYVLGEAYLNSLPCKTTQNIADWWDFTQDQRELSKQEKALREAGDKAGAISVSKIAQERKDKFLKYHKKYTKPAVRVMHLYEDYLSAEEFLFSDRFCLYTNLDRDMLLSASRDNLKAGKIRRCKHR